MNIGYTRDTYAERRLFLNSCSDVAYIPRPSIPNPNYPPFFDGNELYNSSWIDADGTIDLVHYFNQINFGTAPFVTTFETTAPRFWNQEAYRTGARILAADTCRKIVALSHATHRIHAAQLDRLAGDLSIDIMDKTIVMQPPQKLLPNDPARFENLNPLRVVFVGVDFFRKGGDVMLKALSSMRRYYPIHLTIVSDLKLGYNVTQSDHNNINATASFIQSNRDWITWSRQLPNDQVLNLVAQAHIGMLPTLSDTYGYSVLEMQAAGTPVITTNVRAMPEINPDDAGWSIEFPYPDGISANLPRQKIEELYEDMQIRLERVLAQILNDMPSIRRKSVGALTRVALHHSPENYRTRTRRLYELSLNG